MIKWCALFVLDNALKNKIKIGQPSQRPKSIWISMAWDNVGVCSDISVSRARTILTVNVLVGVTLSLKNHLNAFLTYFFPITNGSTILPSYRMRITLQQSGTATHQTAMCDTVIKLHFYLKKWASYAALRHDHEYELWHICLHKFKRSQHVHKFTIILCVVVVVYVFSISLTLY